MTLPVYPGASLLRGLGYSSKWTPEFFVQSAKSATGAEIDLLIAQYPLHSFELTYRFLRDGVAWRDSLSALEFRTMMGFFLSMQGTAGRCLYRNPDDYQVFQNQIGTGDGSTRTFTLTRSYGANGYTASEPIGQVIPGELFNVYLAGSSTPVNPTLYTLSTTNPVANTITFTSAPAVGQAITVDMSYYYYCKLADTAVTFEKFMARLWALNKVQLRSCRPNT
jgi:hypothetical protein